MYWPLGFFEQCSPLFRLGHCKSPVTRTFALLFYPLSPPFPPPMCSTDDVIPSNFLRAFAIHRCFTLSFVLFVEHVALLQSFNRDGCILEMNRICNLVCVTLVQRWRLGHYFGKVIDIVHWGCSRGLLAADGVEGNSRLDG